MKNKIVLFLSALILSLIPYSFAFADEIPVISLSLGGASINDIQHDERLTLSSCNIDGNEFTEITTCQIKGRGNSTWTYEQKPYQIKFDSKQDLFGLGAAKKWVLLANYTDASKLRNDTALYIGNRLGIEGTQPGVFIDLYINNEYRGIYYLVHQVENSKTSINLENENGILVEMDNFSNREADDIYRYGVDGSRLVVKDAYDTNNVSLTTASLERFVSKYDAVYQAAERGDWEYLSQNVDLHSAVAMYFINNFSANVDGGISSFYMYQDGENDLIHFGPVWDFDYSFGNRTWYDGATDQANTSRDWTYGEIRKTFPEDSWEYEFENSIVNVNKLFSLMMDIDSFKMMVIDIYNNEFKEIIVDTIDREKHLAVDIEKSAVNTNSKYQIGSFEDESDYLMHWIDARFEYFNVLYSNPINNIKDSNYKIKIDDAGTDVKITNIGNGYYTIQVNDRYLTALDEKFETKEIWSRSAIHGDRSYWSPRFVNGDIVFLNKQSGRYLSFKNGIWYETSVFDSSCCIKLPQTIMHELLGFMLGDVNLNGFVNIVDAQIAYDVANGLYNGKEIYSQLFNLSDVNGDWYVDAADAFAIQHFVIYHFWN